MSKRFNLTAVAALVMAATHANAALYQVVEVSSAGVETYASAIEAVTVDRSNEPLGCFAPDSLCATDQFSVAGDTKKAYAGFSYKQEVPFGIDNRFLYLDQDDIENYCDNELKYSTCDNWAVNRWSGINGVGGMYRERQAWNLGKYESNAFSFLDVNKVDSPNSPLTPTGTTAIADSKNVVVNGMKGTTLIGNTSSGYYDTGTNAALVYRNRGYFGTTLLLPKQESQGAASIVEKMGRTMAFDSFEYNSKTYVVGAGAVAPFNYTDVDKDYLGDLDNCVASGVDPILENECQNFAFATKPFVWDVTAAGATANGISASLWFDFGNSAGNDTYTTANREDYSAQASARAAIVPTEGTYKGKPVLVGFNTDEYEDRLLMQAAVFYPKNGFSAVEENAWSSTFITDATVRVGDEDIYSNSVATDINENLLVIGEAKRFGNKPISGAANNRLFIADASSGSPKANYFSGGIFFTGAGGHANAINNFNEIVGEIDMEDHREVGGKSRRKRGFIYPYNGTGTVADRSALFKNKAWWLDNLTNGGTYSKTNNQYRIIDATDINDAGVIAATALKCSSGEYDTTSHNAYCGGGTGTETIVAVKLLPIQGATSADIVERTESETTVNRKGAGTGLFALTLLSLLSFRRRK